MNETPNAIKSNNKYGKFFKIILIVVIAALLLEGAFIAGWKVSADSFKAKANRLNQLSNPSSPMYANLSGTITGKVVKVEGSVVFIESSRGGKGNFNISNPIFINEINEGKLKDLGQSKENIRLNETAIFKITVKGFNDGYSVNSITYVKDSNKPAFDVQSAVTSTKQASPSAKTTKK